MEMNIVEPYAHLQAFDRDGEPTPFEQRDGIGLLRRVEYFGRISHRSEDKQTMDTWKRFIQATVMEHGDWSIVEHASASVMIYHDRGVQQELTRHRLPSYTIESTRFVNYEKKMPPSFIMPAELSLEFSRAGNGEATELSEQQLWMHAVNTCESVYKELVRRGVKPQIARSVFPLALAGLIGETCNLRNWRHIFIMRTTRETHPQFRQVTIPLLEEFKLKIPLLFDDIEPLAKQSENLKKPR